MSSFFCTKHQRNSSEYTVRNNGGSLITRNACLQCLTECREIINKAKIILRKHGVKHRNKLNTQYKLKFDD